MQYENVFFFFFTAELGLIVGLGDALLLQNLGIVLAGSGALLHLGANRSL